MLCCVVLGCAIFEQSFGKAPAATRGQTKVGEYNINFSALAVLLTHKASMPTAMDGEHQAMVAEVTLPAPGPPPAPLLRRGAMELQAEARAQTLLQVFRVGKTAT